MAAKKDPEKAVDVPPYGSRNPDPITDSPGSHPIEVGAGAALGGAASGAAVGMVAGPVGAVIGAAVGAIAGGLAGKGVGELIDPTTEDNWLRESFAHKEYAGKKESYEHYEPAYKYAAHAETRYPGKKFDEIDSHLEADWEKSEHAKVMPYKKARPAIMDAHNRTVQLREERLNVGKDKVKTGDVGIRKEVHTEHKQITVPVEREEIVIEHHKTGGKAVKGEIGAEEIRIPISEERVHVTKEAVVTDEVSIGKKKVTEQKTVGADVRKEELIVESEGKAKVREKDGK